MHDRIAARTAGGPVNGDMIQLCGVSAFLSLTLSREVVRHFSRSALYCSVVRSPLTGGSYGAPHALAPSSTAEMINEPRSDRMCPERRRWIGSHRGTMINPPPAVPPRPPSGAR